MCVKLILFIVIVGIFLYRVMYLCSFLIFWGLDGMFLVFVGNMCFRVMYEGCKVCMCCILVKLWVEILSCKFVC